MKKSANYAYLAAGLLLAGLSVQSCSVEEPFGAGDGVLSMKLEINSDVTRAAMSQQELAENCVVYISNDKGLLHKWKNLANVPERLTLRQGHYIGEAWTGDSVPASFDSKFYRCYQPFDVLAGENQLTLTCKIANVVASINSATIDPTMVSDINVTVATSTGSLEFNSSNWRDAKGYFMMPFDAEGNRESVLNVTVTGKNILGEPFTIEKRVEKVRPAYEYRISLSYDPDDKDPDGCGLVSIIVDEHENEVKDTVEIFAPPAIEGVDFDIDKQIVGEAGQFSGDKVVKVVAFNEITSFTIECVDTQNLHIPAGSIDLKNCTDGVVASLNSAGITWDKEVQDMEGYDGMSRQLSYITFSEKYLNSLPERATEYRIILTATDGVPGAEDKGKTTTRTLRIAVGENAIVYEDPVIAEEAVDPNNVMAVGATKATLNLSVKDDAATGIGLQYREAGSDGAWTKAMLTRTRAVNGSVTLTGLKPGTRYEYQAIADGFTSSDTKYFTTEEIFVIPNASMEEWSDYSENSKVLLPAAGGTRTFWDSGNHGSATMNVTLTQSSTEMFHSGTQSARLRSQFVGLGGLGKFAAGNLFVGEYAQTKGTNGVINFGREYNGSHPSALKVWVNYRPGVVDEKGSKGGKLKKGDLDKGQIYVALTTEKKVVDTSDTSTLWNTDSPIVLAYGDKIFSENYGPDGGLQELVIPINYKAAAKTTKPLYLVIVCTASYYGDYFDGGEGSTMYVDDFELIYE